MTWKDWKLAACPFNAKVWHPMLDGQGPVSIPFGPDPATGLQFVLSKNSTVVHDPERTTSTDWPPGKRTQDDVTDPVSVSNTVLDALHSGDV